MTVGQVIARIAVNGAAPSDASADNGAADGAPGAMAGRGRPAMSALDETPDASAGDAWGAATSLPARPRRGLAPDGVEGLTRRGARGGGRGR